MTVTTPHSSWILSREFPPLSGRGQHIVTNEKLAFALKNIESSINPGGALFLTPVVDHSRPHLFYNSEWSLEDIRPFFEGWEISPYIKYRGGNLVTLRKPLHA